MRDSFFHLRLSVLGLALSSLVAQAQPTATVSGSHSYTGRQPGDVWIIAVPNLQNLSTNVAWKTRLSPPAGAYTNAFVLPNVWSGFAYYLFAWRDSNGNGTNDVTEARFLRPYGPFTLTNNLLVADFMLEDPDDDADGLPDWWEVQFGLKGEVGSGRSGTLRGRLGQTNYTDSVRASVVGVNPVNSSTLNVSSTNGFAVNDLVLMIVMQDPNLNLAENRAGVYEFGRIASMVSNVFTLTQPLTRPLTAMASEQIQVIKVPEYLEVTLEDSSALSLNGTSQYVTAVAPSVPSGNSTYTLEAWIKPDVMNNGGVVGWGNWVSSQATALRLEPNIGLRHYWFNNDLVANTGPLTGAWHHVAATFDGTTRRILLDGMVVASDTPVNHNVTTTGNFAIGRTYTTEYFDGEIDEVRIWNRARTPAEIQADMYAPLNGNEAGLVGYWRLEEGSGTTSADATGRGQTGNLMNGALWVPRPASLTCHPWDGTSGGVLAFLAHSITLGTNTVVTADGTGYRGGGGVLSTTNYGWGFAGERITGFSTNRETTSLERLYGGGGAGKGADGSGGGGSHATIGGNGACALAGTPPNNSDYGRGALSILGTENLARLYPGGGGGGSGSHAPASGNRIGVGGGAGGGILLIAAGSIQGAGTISSQGAPGMNGSTLTTEINSGSGGGGGAGGSIYISASVANSIRFSATGGAGGARYAPPANSKSGGAGGSGRIRLDLAPSADSFTNALPPAGMLGRLPSENLLLWAAYEDNDRDGVSDLDEYRNYTSPLNADTDGDTLPDYWEIACGLEPTDPGDGTHTADADHDGVCNLVEFRRSTHPNLGDSDGDGLSDYDELFVWHTDPMAADTDGDGPNDGAEVGAGYNPLAAGTRYSYDSIDRLVGVQYNNGLALGYEYDGNNNLVRQIYGRIEATATNALPDLWEFLNDLTNNTSGYADTDADGWSDFQEWQAGTDPRDTASMPNLLGTAGTKLASLQLAFTPANFVVGAGQLDGLGPEEIVIGADGNPGLADNFLLVLSQTQDGWATQRVNIGKFGVTSIAVGQPANRPGAAIYLGLRQASGTGRIAELKPNTYNWTGTIDWTVAPVFSSTNEAAFVLGVRLGRDVLASLANTNGPPGWPFYLGYAEGAWTALRANTNTSSRGLGAMIPAETSQCANRGVRLLDSGEIQVVGDEGFVPFTSLWNGDYSRWFYLNPTNLTWEISQSYARQLRGNLATITDAGLNTWVRNNFLPAASSFWIGLSRQVCCTPHATCGWQWASGAPFNYSSWVAGEPNCSGGTEMVAHLYSAGWNDVTRATIYPGLVELTFSGPSITADEPLCTSRLLWRGQSVAAGNLRLAKPVSILYAYVEDQNTNNIIDGGDDLLLAEYSFSNDALNLFDLRRIPLSGTALAQSYGLAAADVLYGTEQAFFTAEPDGSLYVWTATNAATGLKRQLFSAHDTGKAWHALTALRTLEPAHSLAGLRVDPATPDRCDVILWPPQRSLWTGPECAQTAPVTSILPGGGPVASTAVPVGVRLWDAEGNPSHPELQFRWPGSSTWVPAVISQVDNSACTPDLKVTAMPNGSDHMLTWNASAVFTTAQTNLWFRARASDLCLAGEWSSPVEYALVSGSDGDAMPDAWEVQYFGHTGRDGTGDYDGDGFTDAAEYAADTIPTDATSYLRVTAIGLDTGGVQISWKGGIQARQVLEKTLGLGGTNVWFNLQTWEPPTAATGVFVDPMGSNRTMFYRIRAQRP